MRAGPVLAGFSLGLAAVLAYSQFRGGRDFDTPREPNGAGAPEAEFHMARVVYETAGCGGSHGYCNPWWAIDYPAAEIHFLPALERFTRVAVAHDSAHLPLNDPRIFDFPWLFLQQVYRGGWSPGEAEIANLREYLARGGFLVVDDFHSEHEWQYFEEIIREILPGREIVTVPPEHALMTILFDLDTTVQIPGRRHLSSGPEGPPHWRGIYDDAGRLMVAIDHNIDMGDAWEHADDPQYPAEMTGMAYRFGTNYVIYAMTH